MIRMRSATQRVETGVEAGEALKPATLVGRELDPEPRIPLEEVEQALDFRVGRGGDPVEREIPLDQLEQLPPIFRFGCTDDHRASLASV